MTIVRHPEPSRITQRSPTRREILARIDRLRRDSVAMTVNPEALEAQLDVLYDEVLALEPAPARAARAQTDVIRGAAEELAEIVAKVIPLGPLDGEEIAALHVAGGPQDQAALLVGEIAGACRVLERG